MKLSMIMTVAFLAGGLWAEKKIDLAKGREHWAFQPVKRPA